MTLIVFNRFDFKAMLDIVARTIRSSSNLFTETVWLNYYYSWNSVTQFRKLFDFVILGIDEDFCDIVITEENAAELAIKMLKHKINVIIDPIYDLY